MANYPKTVEGSVAFMLSVVVSVWALRLCGLTETFSVRGWWTCGASVLS